jgi:hypothetical protein
MSAVARPCQVPPPPFGVLGRPHPPTP